MKKACRFQTCSTVAANKLTLRLTMKLQKINANSSKTVGTTTSESLFFCKQYQIIIFNIISHRYEALDAHSETSTFLQSSNFVFETPAESSKSQMNFRVTRAKFLGPDSKFSSQKKPLAGSL